MIVIIWPIKTNAGLFVVHAIGIVDTAITSVANQL